MSQPDSIPDAPARRSRRPLTMIGAAVFIVVIMAVAMLQIQPRAESQIIAMLEKAGFRNVSIGSLSVLPAGIRAKDIRLDQYGFDKIDQLDAELNWPTFLTTGRISNLEIKGMNLLRRADQFPTGGRQLANNLLNLPGHRVSMNNVVLDLDTGFGAIRVTVDATAEPAKDDTHKVQANIKADQYQLGFSSNWQGTVKKGGAVDLTGNVLDGRLNLGPLRISRFNGWVGTSIGENGYTLQSQLEAGSASFMNVPLQTVSVINDSNTKQDDMIVRSGISGMPDILFTADLTRTETNQSFTAALRGKNLGGFLDYIDEATKKSKRIDETLLNIRDFELVGSFQPEKRFVGGPLPFGIRLNADNEKILDGNVLFYPDTFDVRGSLETEPAMAMALKDYFKIPSANLVQNFIRLDGDMRKFLGLDAVENKDQSQR